MNRRGFPRAIAALMAMGIVPMITGCSGSSNHEEVTAANLETVRQQRIKDIESNPNMPQAAKDAAIGALKNSGKQAGAPPTSDSK